MITGEDLTQLLEAAGITSVWRVKGPYTRGVGARWLRFEVYVDEFHDARRTPDQLRTHPDVVDVGRLEAVPYGFMVNAYVNRPPDTESGEQMTSSENAPGPTAGATGSAPADQADAHGRGSDARAHRRPRHRAGASRLR